MAELEEQLLRALDAVSGSGAKPCGCSETAATAESELFSDVTVSASGDLEGQLDSALGALSSDLTAFDTLAVEDELLFAEVDQGPELNLRDVLETAERYPGLKITFSF